MKRMFLIPFVSALLGGGSSSPWSPRPAASAKARRRPSRRSQAARPAAPSNASQRSSGLTPHEVYVRDAPGVAFVTSTVVQKSESPFNLFGEESQRQGTATGSGIVIDANGTILTNYHVVENAIKVTVSFEKGKTVEAKVVGKDPSNDLAVLRISTDGLTLHPLTLGDSSAVAGRRPGVRDRQPVRPRTHADDRRHLGAAAPDHRSQRLHDRQRAADRRADQPRQLRRPAAERRGRSDRHQLADRDRRQRRRQRRHRLRRSRSTRPSPRSPSSRKAAPCAAPTSA